jgi:hypothetical protein
MGLTLEECYRQTDRQTDRQDKTGAQSQLIHFSPLFIYQLLAIFHNIRQTYHLHRSDRPSGQHSLLYNGYGGSFPGIKRPGHSVDHPLPSSAEVKSEWSYTSIFPSVPVMVCFVVTFTFTSPSKYRVLNSRYGIRTFNIK